MGGPTGWLTLFPWRMWLRPMAALGVGSAVVLARLALQPTLGPAAPLLLAWPATMLAALIAGFWPAMAVALLGLVVGQHVLAQAGAARIGPIASLIYLAFGVVFATAGELRKRALRRERANAERLAALQDQLLNVGRLNMLGEMVGGLTHELNQPLTAITSYLAAARRLIERDDPPHARIVELLEKTGEQAVRASEVIGRIRARVRGAELELEATSLSKIAQETVPVALMGWPQDAIATRINLDATADRVLADRVQVQQVLLNLVRNAAEATDGQRRREIVIASRRQASLVEVCVADTGPGISPEVSDRLFQPFASTKESGMGMGLLISRNIVQAHGGDLWAEANDQGGATFRFTLREAVEGPAA